VSWVLINDFEGLLQRFEEFLTKFETAGCDPIVVGVIERAEECIVGKNRSVFVVGNWSKMALLHRTWGNASESAPFLGFCNRSICAMPATPNAMTTTTRQSITIIIVSIVT
jgi:hypothetical protein